MSLILFEDYLSQKNTKVNVMLIHPFHLNKGNVMRTIITKFKKIKKILLITNFLLLPEILGVDVISLSQSPPSVDYDLVMIENIFYQHYDLISSMNTVTLFTWGDYIPKIKFVNDPILVYFNLVSEKNLMQWCSSNIEDIIDNINSDWPNKQIIVGNSQTTCFLKNLSQEGVILYDKNDIMFDFYKSRITLAGKDKILILHVLSCCSFDIFFKIVEKINKTNIECIKIYIYPDNEDFILSVVDAYDSFSKLKFFSKNLIFDRNNNSLLLKI